MPGDDQFWIVDASIGYRLPKRWGLITLGVKNLLDEDFRFQDTDPARPIIYPERLIFARVSLAF
jgi:outer membrane receptor protein involved in Fe transport